MQNGGAPGAYHAGGKTVKTARLIEGTLALLIGALSIVTGVRLTIDKIPGVLYDTVGPGIFGVLVGTGLLAVGILHLRMPDTRPAAAAGRSVVNRRVLGIVGACVLYLLLIDAAGYPAASVVFFLLAFRLSGVSSWMSSLVIAVCLTAAYYGIFVMYFDLLFPRGLFFK
jgi:hypothetical protein